MSNQCRLPGGMLSGLGFGGVRGGSGGAALTAEMKRMLLMISPRLEEIWGFQQCIIVLLCLDGPCWTTRLYSLTPPPPPTSTPLNRFSLRAPPSHPPPLTLSRSDHRFHTEMPAQISDIFNNNQNNPALMCDTSESQIRTQQQK